MSHCEHQLKVLHWAEMAMCVLKPETPKGFVNVVSDVKIEFTYSFSKGHGWEKTEFCSQMKLTNDTTAGQVYKFLKGMVEIAKILSDS